MKLAGVPGATTTGAGAGIMKVLAVASSGIVLRVEDGADPDSLALSVYFSSDRIDGRKYLLVADRKSVV